MRVIAFVAFLMLGACKDEPDFDERYSQAASDIRAKAEDIDEDLQAKKGMDRAEATPAASKRSMPQP